MAPHSSPAPKVPTAKPPGPTAAYVDALDASVGFHPDTPIEEGVRRFIGWYREYCGA